MNKGTIACMLLLVLGFTQTEAQVSGNYQYNNNQNIQNTAEYQNNYREPATNAAISNNNEVMIEVNGLSNVVADQYVAVFNLVQVAETIENADQLMNSRINAFKQKLKEAGIDTLDVSIDMVSFVPKYDLQSESKLFSKSFNEIPSGFEVQKNVSVHYKSSSKLNEIISVAANSEIYDLIKVDYFATNIKKAMDSLRTKCLFEIKAKTKNYEIVGFKLDTLKKTIADNFTTIYPQTRYFSYQAFSRPSLNAAKRKSSMVNEVTKSTSRFYNQVNYDHYDVIINPLILEPVIQISYTVVVKYFLKQEEKPSNNYYIISQTGDLKQVFPK